MLLHYLHISDLHLTYEPTKVGGSGSHQPLNQDVVTKSMLKSINDIVAKGQGFDFIVLSGDIAHGGKREEYEHVAEPFVKELLAITKVPADKLFMVPGNHDVDRSKIVERQIRLFHRFDTQDEINENLRDKDASALYRSKFDNFNFFAETISKRNLFGEQNYHYTEVVDLLKGGQSYRFNVVGLNSALFCGYKGDDQKKLALGLEQVHPAISQLAEDALFSLVILHHPFPCFHEADKDCQTQLIQVADLLLTGHLHDPENTVVSHPMGKTVIIGAGAGYETRESANSFNIVQLDLTTGHGEAAFYKYVSRRNMWIINNELNILNDRSVFEFKIEKIAEKAVAQPDNQKKTVNPTGDIKHTHTPPLRIDFIHDELQDEHFVARTEEMERLKPLFLGQNDPVTNNKSSVVALTAIGGVGKSCLIRQAAQHYLEETPFRKVIWYSLDAARTEDVGHFFRSILEKINGVPIEIGAKTPEQLSEDLKGILDQTPILLILDGFEAIQNTGDEDSPNYGRVVETHSEIRRLLSHLCIEEKSRAIITSRVGLKDYSGKVGYVEIPLTTFSPSAGAALLRSYGVEGTSAELEACSAIFGGHALCLVAAGIDMANRLIPASEVERLVGDPRVFSRSSEGERVAKIVDGIRADLSSEEEHFLIMMSLHPRPVTEENFPVLVKGYILEGKDHLQPTNTLERNKIWAHDHIIAPLRKRGLIEILKNSDDSRSFTAHPLMKVAYSTWLDKDRRKRAHEEWALAARHSPAMAMARFAKSIEELQVALDAVEAYLNAENYGAAWDIYYGLGIFQYLDRLNYAKRQLAITKRFESALDNGDLELNIRNRLALYESIARAYSKQSFSKKAIHYSEKIYHIVQKEGDSPDFDSYRDKLIANYTFTGYIKRAVSLASTDLLTQGQIELYSGNYLKSIKILSKEYEESNGHRKTVAGSSLSESLARSGNIKEAEDVINESIKLAKEENYLCCLKDHLKITTLIMMKQGLIDLAKSNEAKRIDLYKKWGRNIKKRPFLLILENKYDLVINTEKNNISTKTEEKFHKDGEIESLIVLSQAWWGKGDTEQARQFLTRAFSLAEQTGCWHYKDQMQETVQMIGMDLKVPVESIDVDRMV